MAHSFAAPCQGPWGGGLCEEKLTGLTHMAPGPPTWQARPPSLHVGTSFEVAALLNLSLTKRAAKTAPGTTPSCLRGAPSSHSTWLCRAEVSAWPSVRQVSMAKKMRAGGALPTSPVLKVGPYWPQYSGIKNVPSLKWFIVHLEHTQAVRMGRSSPGSLLLGATSPGPQHGLKGRPA